MASCSDCACRYCLYWWSGRCPHGKCRDDWRAVHAPWPGKIRKLWSDWDKPGEQAHWCRGGALYPADECQEFVQYTGQEIEQCYRSPIRVFQDGYRICPMMVNGTCEQCLKGMANIIESHSESMGFRRKENEEI